MILERCKDSAEREFYLRSGDIDPAIVSDLMRKEGLNAGGVEKFFNKQCGLAGVSGFSADTRELRDRISERPAKLALDMFAYRVRKYICAYLAVLGGADAVFFGGGIGENTQIVREKICKGWSGAAHHWTSQKIQLRSTARTSSASAALQFRFG